MKDTWMFPTKPDIPTGYKRVIEGAILPDDLLWDVMNRVFRRADSGDWKYKAVDVDEVIYCLREICFR